MTMKVLIALLFSLYLTGGHGAEFYTCNWVTQSYVNCTHFPAEKICANNRVTYDNKCEFSQAHCVDTDIDLLHQGACTTADGVTPAPVAGTDVVFDFFCTHLSHRDCPTDVSPVCADNGMTFENTCEFEKYKCTHQNAHIASFGPCL